MYDGIFSVVHVLPREIGHNAPNDLPLIGLSFTVKSPDVGGSTEFVLSYDCYFPSKFATVSPEK